MKPVQNFIVSARLPESLSKLKEIAYNYWWCWNSEAKELFLRIDRKIWDDVHHNPVLLLNKLPQEKLQYLSEQSDMLSFLDYIYEKYEKYMKAQTWFDDIPDKPEGRIAYFSPEFGINESFPNYSGGLGVLAGDHLKSASDLGLPLVGVGLLYQQGYFRQRLTQSGWQNEMYHYNDFFSMPLVLMKDGEGKPIIIDVDLPYGKAFAQIWKVRVGRLDLFLLDTNIAENQNAEYRDISDQLYGGTRETRIQQEVMLGIGGMRALKALNIFPEVTHINEGHAAFALLERTRMFMEKYGLDFHSAKLITKGSSVFTTHTPVPAGNEVFRLDRIDNYFHKYYPLLGLSKEEFISIGQIEGYNEREEFSMTILGLRLTAFRNGVSKLHGEVARKMWRKLWKCFPNEEVPIQHITNGIHTSTWIAREFSELFDRYLSPRWRSETDDQSIWDKIASIPSEELWREKQRRRVRLVLFARDYLKNKQKNFIPSDQIGKINEYLDPDALTIGFARRFATYKRATLLFRDMDRLSAILTNKDNPVQVVIAGKAHPHDTAGKEVIQNIIQKVRAYNLEKHVVFLEDYDMVIARMLVKGADVWLNNPIRPMEASGTSGMKAAINGALNFSILDGWWDEAYNGKNGFAIGGREGYSDQKEQDVIESAALYDMLEQFIVPLFYNRGSLRFPEEWVTMMKETIRTIAGSFSTMRMLKEYADNYYMKALSRYWLLSNDNARNAIELKKWKEHISGHWNNIEIIDVSTKQKGEVFSEEPINVSAIVSLGGLRPEDVSVQVYYGGVDHHGAFINTQVEELQLKKSDSSYHHYEGSYICPETGKQGFTVRVLPSNKMMTDPSELYLCSWA